MAPFAPSAFGKYFLVDKIATGGMAEIFKAKTYGHGGFESLVCIKRILPHVGENADFVAMFVDEAKLSVALQHPNIVRVMDFGQQADNYFIAMECVEGKDVRGILRKLAKKGEALPWQLAATIGHETSRGLHYAHTKTDLNGDSFEIVHRDISPSNILVGYDGQVKIADFGIAKAQSNSFHTQTGVLKGKFEYMSPEQANGLSLDHRSDQFAVGILLWEMLAGTRLFKTDNDIATLRLITEGQVVPPSTHNPEVPPSLDSVVMRALARDPDDRYADMAQLAEDLRTVMLPNAPEEGRDQLASYMSTVFHEEIEAEVSRLTQNSAVAARLRASGDWDNEATSIRPPPHRPQIWPLLLLVLAVGVGMVSLAMVGVFVAVNSAVQEEAVAAIDVVVEPEARVFVDGTLRGTGMTVVVSRLEPGEHVLRLEADGYESEEHRVTVTSGEAMRYETVLKPLADEGGAEAVDIAPAPAETPTATKRQTEPSVSPTPRVNVPAAEPPRVRVTSDPPGATVLLRGKVMGTTPFVMAAKPGESLGFRLESEGFTAAEGVVKAGEAGSTTVFSRTLESATEPASLTVLLVGGGWAHVYVDGVKLPKTAPLRGLELKPGRHEIRVVNPALGIQHAETVTVGSGQSITVRAAPQ